ncbi:MAG: hypothetical protein HYR64_10215 [Fimbriimonas ginsengisoli]|uniref:Uncharacterized protein n=1 Tax=Fimbriimonas ginsengisoli TaxID=1005039 RepID=A0A931M1X0_FIMGI|nr:hypothetical protein [Fimbriimonas ginsengisoli]
MEVFCKRSDIEGCLTRAFRERYLRKDVALTGILLARPEDKLAKDEILPNLEYWHYRSDYHTDFFCAGYVPVEFTKDARPVGVEIAGLEWGFSVASFVELVEAIERETGWCYNGGACLLLANSYFDGIKAKLDFSRSIRVDLRQAMDAKGVRSATELAELVFQFAKSVNESTVDPVWELSNSLGRRVIKRGLKDLLLSWAPTWLGGAVDASIEFAVHELKHDDA